MSKRPASGSLGGLLSQSAKEAKRTASDRPSSSSTTGGGTGGASAAAARNPFLSRPTQPEDAIKIFLVQARSTARRLGLSGGGNDGNNANVEIEARLGTLVSPLGPRDMRALPSGPKVVPVGGERQGRARVRDQRFRRRTAAEAGPGAATDDEFRGGGHPIELPEMDAVGTVGIVAAERGVLVRETPRTGRERGVDPEVAARRDGKRDDRVLLPGQDEGELRPPGGRRTDGGSRAGPFGEEGEDVDHGRGLARGAVRSPADVRDGAEPRSRAPPRFGPVRPPPRMDVAQGQETQELRKVGRELRLEDGRHGSFHLG